MFFISKDYIPMPFPYQHKIGKKYYLLKCLGIIWSRMTPNRTLRYFSFFVKKIPDLSGKERQVLLGRLRKKTLETIGKSFGLTEGRIRQVEKTAIKKIKSNSHQLALFKKNI
jgi:DNA-binding CsgD family transcriptional regulator